MRFLFAISIFTAVMGINTPPSADLVRDGNNAPNNDVRQLPFLPNFDQPAARLRRRPQNAPVGDDNIQDINANQQNALAAPQNAPQNERNLAGNRRPRDIFEGAPMLPFINFGRNVNGRNAQLNRGDNANHQGAAGRNILQPLLDDAPRLPVFGANVIDAAADNGPNVHLNQIQNPGNPGNVGNNENQRVRLLRHFANLGNALRLPALNDNAANQGNNIIRPRPIRVNRIVTPPSTPNTPHNPGRS